MVNWLAFFHHSAPTGKCSCDPRNSMGIGGKQFPSELAEGLRVLCTSIVLRTLWSFALPG
ncbi:hypothetical protein PISMIDRAFT_672911 [Pisolithus microcarpus 441]|uniref:Unplaced genomic scaffold scaffold_7, whole genome shotgun sequence n=1 Tax=Pisolithus microcarpus 441 TaxID=765257 RepID=A0A0C9YUM3_9AGAM|nr:hypothetical protein PISMIDRAFT_672911 [Pisolithus microcarpus 441]